MVSSGEYWDLRLLYSSSVKIYGTFEELSNVPSPHPSRRHFPISSFVPKGRTWTVLLILLIELITTGCILLHKLSFLWYSAVPFHVQIALAVACLQYIHFQFKPPHFSSSSNKETANNTLNRTGHTFQAHKLVVVILSGNSPFVAFCRLVCRIDASLPATDYFSFIFHLRPCLPRGLLPLCFPTKVLYFCSPPYVLHAPPISSSLDHSNNIQIAVPIMKLLVMQFSPFSCYFLFLIIIIIIIIIIIYCNWVVTRWQWLFYM